MLKETKISMRVKRAIFHFEGTEMVEVSKLMELTKGHPLEIIFEGDDLEGSLNLLPDGMSPKAMVGQLVVEFKEREPEEEC